MEVARQPDGAELGGFGGFGSSSYLELAWGGVAFSASPADMRALGRLGGGSGE